jgi:hypothetical protein
MMDIKNGVGNKKGGGHFPNSGNAERKRDHYSLGKGNKRKK